MRETLGQMLMIAGTFLMLLGNAIWYEGKVALQRKGYPVSLFMNHFRDYEMLNRAIAEELDPREQERLRTIRTRMRALLVIFPLAVLSIAGGSVLAKVR